MAMRYFLKIFSIVAVVVAPLAIHISDAGADSANLQCGTRPVVGFFLLPPGGTTVQELGCGRTIACPMSQIGSPCTVTVTAQVTGVGLLEGWITFSPDNAVPLGACGPSLGGCSAIAIFGLEPGTSTIPVCLADGLGIATVNCLYRVE